MLIYKNGVKNGVSTLLLFDKNGVPQHSLFDVKSENGVKNGVHTLFYMIAQNAKTSLYKPSKNHWVKSTVLFGSPCKSAFIVKRNGST